MPTAIVTGSGGLIGSESVTHFVERGLRGRSASRTTCARASSGTTRRPLARPQRRRGASPTSSARSPSTSATPGAVDAGVRRARRTELELVIHTAAQPSHDWAASDPQTDFGVNANGTLEPARGHAHARADATFIFCSTNKVYGDLPNHAAADRARARLELPERSPLLQRASIRRCRSTRAPIRCSASPRRRPICSCRSTAATSTCPPSASAAGCLTGPNHAGTQLHGFLSYLMRCTMTGEPYTVFGYGGKQVRDNIHSADLVAAFEAFHRARRAGAVYNIGGGRQRNCSMLEAIELCQEIAGRELTWSLGGGQPDRRSPLVDQRSGAVPGATTRTGTSPTTSRTSCARSTTATPSGGSPAMKLSVVIPAHNERDSIGATVEAIRRSELEAEQMPVRDRGCRRRQRRRHRRGRARDHRTRYGGPLRSFAALARGSARRCARAWTCTRATPSRS